MKDDGGNTYPSASFAVNDAVMKWPWRTGSPFGGCARRSEDSFGLSRAAPSCPWRHRAKNVFHSFFPSRARKEADSLSIASPRSALVSITASFFTPCETSTVKP